MPQGDKVHSTQFIHHVLFWHRHFYIHSNVKSLFKLGYLNIIVKWLFQSEES